jgi:ribose-phosphate pyrophosphokinase
MSVDLHAAQIQGSSTDPSITCSPSPCCSSTSRTPVAEDREKLTVVSPDTGACASPTSGPTRSNAPLAIIHKRRDPNVANQVTVNEIVGHVDGASASSSTT